MVCTGLSGRREVNGARTSIVGYCPSGAGGWCFSAGTIDWPNILARQTDPVVDRITRNVLPYPLLPQVAR